MNAECLFYFVHPTMAVFEVLQMNENHRSERVSVITFVNQSRTVKIQPAFKKDCWDCLQNDTFNILSRTEILGAVAREDMHRTKPCKATPANRKAH